MSIENEITELIKERAIHKKWLMKAKLNKEAFENVIKTSAVDEALFEEQKAHMDDEIKWLKQIIEYYNRRLKTAKKRQKKRKNS